jgi:hypothetical protein
MQKYNFYQLKDLVFKGKSLPADVNAPVHRVINENLGCPEASKALVSLEKSTACGELQIFFNDYPKFIKIKTNYGMVEGYDLVEDLKTERYSFSVLRHIKNENLSMKKPERKDRNGHSGDKKQA